MWRLIVRSLAVSYASVSMTSHLQAAQDDSKETTPKTATGYDRPAGDHRQSRSVVIAQHGMVATSQPLAAQAGLDVLKAGGNAADAAVATSATMGVVEPMSCGIGGDLFIIY